MFYRSVLAGGIHRLKHDEDRVSVVGVELVLKLLHISDVLFQPLLCRFFCHLSGVRGVEIVGRVFFSRLGHKAAQHLFFHNRLHS
jgi:hypothetical protein